MNIYERSEMITKEEFVTLLKTAVYAFLSDFPKEEVEEFLDSEFAKAEIDEAYEASYARYKVSRLEHPNKVFAAGISKSANLLALCF